MNKIFYGISCLILTINCLATNDLPNLGDGSNLSNPKQEYLLGRALLGILRKELGQITDPALKEFIENSVYKLAETSQLQDRELEFIIVDSNQINAFAAPGGVVGVNGGIFLHAETEAEYASIMAHELAHLSQRHYIRGLEARQKLQMPLMAAILAGAIAAASGSAEVGMAAIATGQAAAFQTTQGFSRQVEQEADRIGIINLAKAGFDPHAMPNMFERMLKQYQYGEKAPEFFLTHPVTESRIADTKGRAEQIIKENNNYKKDSFAYQIMRIRMQIYYEKSKALTVKKFQNLANQNKKTNDNDIYKYGYILALSNDNQFNEAIKLLEELLKKYPNNFYYNLLYVEILAKVDKHSTYLPVLEKLLKQYPNNYVVKQYQIDYLIAQNNWNEANKLLNNLLKVRSFDPEVWQQSVQVRGNLGDLTGLHQAQAEYLILHGEYTAALQQLGLAKKYSGPILQLLAKIDNREQQVISLQKIAKQLR